MRRVVLFAGAGASAAVNPKVYPTTADFFNRLPESITKDRFFTLAHNCIQHQLGGLPIDVEIVLWRLRELADRFHEISDSKSILGYALGGTRLAQALGSGTEGLQRVGEFAKHAAPKVEDLIGRINEQVYDLYSRQPTAEELADNWSRLLAGLVLGRHQFDIFTTNYDVVIEKALSLSGIDEVQVGWKADGVYRLLARELWSTRSPEERHRRLLTKLHGSVNWTRDGEDQIHFSDPLYKGDHRKHVILYPGFKGRPEEEPFASFHEHLGRCLSRTEVVVFIGFANRDEYIAEICHRFMQKGTDVISLNPVRVENIPARQSKNLFHVEAGFGVVSTDNVLSIVNRKRW